jgi:hypothetical protein
VFKKSTALQEQALNLDVLERCASLYTRFHPCWGRPGVYH